MPQAEHISRIKRGSHHSATLNITSSELAERAVVVVGDNPGELQPPYRSEGFELFACTVLKYIASQSKIIIVGSSKNDHNGEGDYNHQLGKQKYPEVKVFEVVGMNAGACVAFAVQQIISLGDLAFVQSTHISDLNASKHARLYSNFTNGRILINEVLRRQPESTCTIIAPETFLFMQKEFKS